jgi:geranylgeranyl reductase family protein
MIGRGSGAGEEDGSSEYASHRAPTMPENVRAPSPGTRSSVIRADVAIIGAGPAGLAAAIHLGQLGVGRVVVVDRQDFPRDKTCGSAISPKGIDVLHALGAQEAVASAAYRIKGLRLVTPGDRELVLSGHTDAALICCRRTLDHILLRRAVSLGVRFVGGFQASYLLCRNDRVAGFRGLDGCEVLANHTVVADGAHSQFCIDRGRRRLIQAIMGWWEDVRFEPQHIEMIFDRMVEPFYGWLFPEGPDRVNIGICYDDPRLAKNARELFTAFLDKHYRDRLHGARQIGAWKGHPVAYALPIGPLVSPGRIVTGEAGRMTHPATAEGIYQGMRSGMLAAEALRDILRGDGDEAAAHARYEAACRRSFGRSFRGAFAWRRIVSWGGLDLLAGAMNRPIVRRQLARGMARM